MRSRRQHSACGGQTARRTVAVRSAANHPPRNRVHENKTLPIRNRSTPKVNDKIKKHALNRVSEKSERSPQPGFFAIVLYIHVSRLSRTDIFRDFSSMKVLSNSRRFRERPSIYVKFCDVW